MRENKMKSFIQEKRMEDLMKSQEKYMNNRTRIKINDKKREMIEK